MANAIWIQNKIIAETFLSLDQAAKSWFFIILFDNTSIAQKVNDKTIKDITCKNIIKWQIKWN